jgi:hypothetical protein
MTMADSFPHGFILSEAALYAFQCQEVYPDILSFAVAIPDHLKSLFLIPIQIERVVASHIARVASRIASCRIAEGPIPTGETEEADFFGTKTFVYDDNKQTLPSTEDGSIFETDGADNLTHHQEYNFDSNLQSPTDTSYMSDVDMTQYWDYPYRQDQKPVRHSSIRVPVLMVRLALKPEALEPRVPEKIKTNAKSCSVQLISYDKRSRVFTFGVNCGNGVKTVHASMSDLDHVALSCTCPFWRWNGPEFHAKENRFLLGQPAGSAAPPEIRDPDRKYWLCKHAYAVLKRLDSFIQEVAEENWEFDNEELLEAVDKEWDRLEGASQIPLEDIEEEDTDVDIDWEEEPDEVDEELEPEDLELEEEEPEEEEPEEEEPEAESETREPEVEELEPEEESEEEEPEPEEQESEEAQQEEQEEQEE